MKIILASKSPRRIDILKNHGIDALIMPTDTDETLPAGIGMTEAVETLAERKARACFDTYCAAPADRERYSGHLIIAADTIVWKDELLGKPAGPEDAARMLRMIRGTYHYVVTGVALMDVDTGSLNVLSEITKVHCVPYTDEDILDYLATGEPYDKAGSYAIQGRFGKYIDHIEGDYENVVGLPFYRIEALLAPYL